MPDLPAHWRACTDSWADAVGLPARSRARTDADPDTAALSAHWRARADAALAAALQHLHADTPPRLLDAMCHAVLTGGKRLRPLLVYAGAHAAGADTRTLPALDAPAVAVELIHAYSLVHDDLPAMDNDTLRRGQPTVHAAFGEALAIIAGDALQALAFATLADAALPDTIRLHLTRELAHAAGAGGMCGGQALDMAATGTRTPLAAPEHRNAQTPSLIAPEHRNAQTPSVTALEHLHALKTGALLRAAVQMGALAAGADAGLRAQLDTYAAALGLAFQIRDDLLDTEGDNATLGKTAGKDAAQDKATFPALIGAHASRQRLNQLAARMHDALTGLPETRRAPLDALARQVIERDH